MANAAKGNGLSRNTVQWKSSFVKVSETQYKMILEGTFYPLDFRKYNMDIISRPEGEGATSPAMHEFLDNQLGNFVFATLYNYAPFVFLKSVNEGLYTNVKDYAYDELGHFDEISMSPTIDKTKFYYNNFNAAAKRFITGNEEWYNTYIGSGFGFNNAINTCMFFGADVVVESMGGGSFAFDNFNKILVDLKANGEQSEYYDRYLVYPKQQVYTVRIVKTITVADEDRTYAICYVNPYSEYPTVDLYYTKKTTSPTHTKNYIIDTNSLTYTSGYVNLNFKGGISPATMEVNTKNKKYKRKKAKIVFKVKRIVE